MIPISKELVKHIEGLLEPGFLVQLEQVGLDIKVRKVARDEANIYIDPVCCSEDSPVLLLLSLKKGGQDLVHITQVLLPEAYWITGIMGARNQPPGEETTKVKESVKKRLARGD